MSTLTQQESNTVQLEIQVEREAFQKACDMAYRKNVGKMNVQGFRRGKAPRKIVEGMYGAQVFYEDAVDIAIPDAYEAAVNEHDLDVIGRPDLDITKLDENGFTFTAKLQLRPEATLKQYKGIHAVKGKVAVPDADVQAELDRLLTRNARVEDSTAPLENGDTAIIDFEGFVDDTAFDGGKGENYKLEIGSGQFIPGFEEQLIGVSAGDKVDVKVTFPEEYHSEELSGKAAVFKVTVHETKRTIKPELDDEFAQDVSEFDTLAEYKADIVKKLEHQREHQVDEAYESALIDELLKGFEGDVPDILIEEQLNSIMQDFSYRMSMQGLELSQYLQYTGQSMEDLQEMHRGTAKRHVMCDMAFHAIAKAENLTVSDEELAAEFEKMAERYKMPTEKVREAIPERSLRRDMLALKGSEYLRKFAIADEEIEETAEIKGGDEKAADEKPAEAKKTKAKKAVKSAEETPSDAKPVKAAKPAKSEKTED